MMDIINSVYMLAVVCFQSSGYGYTVGASLTHGQQLGQQLVYTLCTENVTQSQPFTVNAASQNAPAFFLSSTQRNQYETASDHIMPSSSHRMQNHMTRSGFDDPVDLSSRKLMNGMVKQECHPGDDRNLGNMYGLHNGLHMTLNPEHGKSHCWIYCFIFWVVLILSDFTTLYRILCLCT